MKLKQFEDSDGVLTPIEFKSLPFKVKRLFYVTDVPAGEERGHHAHFKTEQFLICISGKIQVKLYNGRRKWDRMMTPGQAIYVKKMVWDSQIYMTGKDILLVLCSTAYDPNDYIHSMEDFEKILTYDPKH